MKANTIIAAAAAATLTITVGAVAVSSREKPAPVVEACVRAPLDGGTDCKCLRSDFDGGARYIGAGNVCSAGGFGSQCEPAPCRVAF